MIFLVFEEGPSESFTLQWATYQDASDQTSLSRIWGGIHPPIDDIKGRIIGEKIGNESYNLALQYFNGTLSLPVNISQQFAQIYPNPFHDKISITTSYTGKANLTMYTIDGKLILNKSIYTNQSPINMELSNLTTGVYFIKLIAENNKEILVKKVLKN